MEPCLSFPPVDEILNSYADRIGRDMVPYRNHVYRLLNFFSALNNPQGEVPEVVQIAGAFHDIGIWTDHTWDYLEPSIERAEAYLVERGLEARKAEVAALIFEHHKIRPYTKEYAETVEIFRKADLVDVSLGIIKHQIPASFILAVKKSFPNAGFHWLLTKQTARQMLRNPLKPLPVMHW